MQEGEIRPVGGREMRTVDVRVIAATNRDLEADVDAGRFREDLYYRLATVSIHLPPLRERLMDIPVIALTLLEKAQKQLGKAAAGLSPEAIECLKAYRWPGNVRELQNEIQNFLVMGPEGGTIGAEHLSRRILRASPNGSTVKPDPAFASLEGTLHERIEITSHRLSSAFLRFEAWVERRTVFQHGACDVEQTVANGTESGHGCSRGLSAQYIWLCSSRRSAWRRPPDSVWRRAVSHCRQASG